MSSHVLVGNRSRILYKMPRTINRFCLSQTRAVEFLLYYFSETCMTVLARERAIENTIILAVYSQTHRVIELCFKIS